MSANYRYGLIHEIYLEMGDLNADDQKKLAEKLGRKVDPEDSLACDAAYEINGPDPSVGIMTAQVDVTSVSYVERDNHIDVTDFFDLEKVATQIEENPPENPDDEYDRCRNEGL